MPLTMKPHGQLEAMDALKTVAMTTVVCLVLVACEEESTTTTKQAGPQPNVEGTYLHISMPDFYFGTLDVGQATTQEIEISNRGGDIYPVHTVQIVGDNADEFDTDLYEEVVLNPSEAIHVEVTFAPIASGRKAAELTVDYDTIKQVTEAQNQHEQTFYHARDLERTKRYDDSLVAYDTYLKGDPVTINKHRAAIKLPVIKESAVYGADKDFELYLAALNLRDSEDFSAALNNVDTLRASYADSHYADDAVYLRAYIELMDLNQHRDALNTLQRLRKDFPDTTYYDTALYSEALAHHQLGESELARGILQNLKARHTGIAALGMEFPRDNVVSRLWFDRASDMLETL